MVKQFDESIRYIVQKAGKADPLHLEASLYLRTGLVGLIQEELSNLVETADPEQLKTVTALKRMINRVKAMEEDMQTIRFFVNQLRDLRTGDDNPKVE